MSKLTFGLAVSLALVGCPADPVVVGKVAALDPAVQSQASDYMGRMDCNRDGAVTYQEFLAGDMSVRRLGSSEYANRKAVFAEADANRDSKVSGSEMAQYLRALRSEGSSYMMVKLGCSSTSTN